MSKKITMTKDEILTYYIELCNKANKIVKQKEMGFVTIEVEYVK